jgi:predicted subunit of tRNA(5-methylaminomethyl-2-thiouridylate) methyltransferase
LNILPNDLKLALVTKIENWLGIPHNLSGHERNQIERLVTYLRNVTRSQEDQDSQENKINDFVQFIRQYAVRKNKNIESSFPTEFTSWINSL